MTATTTMGAVQAGDTVVGTGGRAVRVSAAYAHHTPESMYRITFADGSHIDASGNHLWYVERDSGVESLRARLRRCRNTLKATEAHRQWLEDVATMPTVQEVSLADFAESLGASGQMTDELIRIAVSVGPVAEAHVVVDTFDLTPTEVQTVPMYDARMLARQVLALTSRAHRKRWPVLMGEVVTTARMAEQTRLGLHVPDA